MEPFRENVKMPEMMFPVRAWLNKGSEYIFVHPHWHDTIEILYIKDGEATQQVNDKIFNVCKGDIVCIASNDVHSTYTYGNIPPEILVVQFNTDFIMPVYDLSSEKRLVADFRDGLDMPSIIKCDTDIGRDILRNLFGIIHEFQDKRIGYEMFIRSNLYEIVGIAARNFHSRKRSSKSNYHMEKAREMLQKTFNLIDNNFDGEITLDLAANTSNLSVSHFCRLFKKAAGMTFRDYLAFYRINRAEALLSSTRSITEIANICGFESMSSFIRAFKQYKNITPSAFRNGRA